MSSLLKAMIGAIVGVFAGASIVFLTVVACIAYAWLSEAEAILPGVFTAFFTVENELPALTFEPNGIGMVVIIGIVTVLSVISSLRARKTDRRPATVS